MYRIYITQKNYVELDMIKKCTMKFFAGQLHRTAPVRRGGQICRCGGTPGARGTGKYSTLIKKENTIYSHM